VPVRMSTAQAKTVEDSLDRSDGELDGQVKGAGERREHEPGALQAHCAHHGFDRLLGSLHRLLHSLDGPADLDLSSGRLISPPARR